MDYELMNGHVGKTIRVDRGGPESRIGKLLEVFDDFFVLLTEKDGVVYYKMEHVKSITESSKDAIKFELEVPEKFEYKTGKNFHGLLDAIKFQWVKINRGGPETLEGVLSECNEKYASLVVNDEVVRFSMEHMRNISYGLKVEKQEVDENTDSNTNTNTNTNTKSKSKEKKDK